MVLNAEDVDLRVSSSNAELQAYFLVANFCFFLLTFESVVRPSVVITMALIEVFLKELLGPKALNTKVSYCRIRAGLSTALVNLVSRDGRVNVNARSEVRLMRVSSVVTAVGPSQFGS